MPMQPKSSKRRIAADSHAARGDTILATIRGAAREGGRWEQVDLGSGKIARVWRVELGDGLTARITTPFSGVPGAPEPSSYEEALLFQLMPPPEPDDMLVDLYLVGVGKVFSISTRDGSNELIGLTPGPWEESFGLPARDWTPAVQRRLARRAAG